MFAKTSLNTSGFIQLFIKLLEYAHQQVSRRALCNKRSQTLNSILSQLASQHVSVVYLQTVRVTEH